MGKFGFAPELALTIKLRTDSLRPRREALLA